MRTGTRDDVREALLAIRVNTLALLDDYATALGSSLQVPQRPELNPPLWEWGHVAWFQEFWVARNRQRARGVACDVAHTREKSCLAGADAWYNSSEVPHDSRWQLALPDLTATRDFLNTTHAQTLGLLDELPLQASDDDLYFFRLVALHEAMHNEAAVYMAQTLGIQVGMALASPPLTTPIPTVHMPAQTHVVGSPAQGFAFDNELGRHPIELAACTMDAAPVSWSRYLPFVQAGGYQDPQWWSPAGWAWLQQSGLKAPRYLRRVFKPNAIDSGANSAITTWAKVPNNVESGTVCSLNPAASATHLSLHEAQAWCRWAGRALPTEAQWEYAALTQPGFAWGSVWEWTASSFAAYPGFVPHPYRDYSQPWFGTHQALRGACAATSPWLAHARYRNFFEAHRNDVAAGFRSCGG